MKHKNISGLRSGRLTAVRYLGNSVWECVCDCGKVKETTSMSLQRGTTTSCGCHHGNTNHNMAGTPTYESWAHMLQRCYNQKTRQYKWYGKIGITVTSDWYSFENFFRDMGVRPLGHTLDRINPFGNYELNNCRWAPTNTGRRHNTPMVGTQTVHEYALQHNLKYHTVYARWKKGTLATPSHQP